jgi:hypothetical protein
VIHWLAHNFGLPTFTDVADISLFWGFEETERERLLDNWKTRLKSPWAEEVKECASDLFAKANSKR